MLVMASLSINTSYTVSWGEKICHHIRWLGSPIITSFFVECSLASHSLVHINPLLTFLGGRGVRAHALGRERCHRWGRHGHHGITGDVGGRFVLRTFLHLVCEQLHECVDLGFLTRHPSEHRFKVLRHGLFGLHKATQGTLIIYAIWKYN